MSAALLNRLTQEKELINGLLAKDHQVFEKLYDNYSQAIYNTILKIVNDKDQADEVLQDTFLRIWNKIDSYSPEKGRLYTWMHQIARNLSLDKVRSKEYRQMAVTDSWEDNSATKYEESNDSSETNFYTDELLRFLNPAQSLVVNLMYFQGYTSEDVSKEFDIPLGTVKSRVRAALKRLRVAYGVEC